MIDIHSHLLYGVDDGSKSFESSVDMLEAAAKDGIKSIVLTPHFSSGISEKIQEKIEILRPEAAKRDIELFSGCEYDFSDLDMQDKLITLGETSKFILVDFCLSFISPITKNFLFNWQSKGYQVIIVHPERLFCKNDLPALRDLSEADIYFQLNAGSFSGDYGRSARRMAKTLIKEKLCHFIASDAHSVKSYKGQIAYARKYIAKRLGNKMERNIFEENPVKMLIGKALS
jgi:protein-tyrosine phosphatase